MWYDEPIPEGKDKRYRKTKTIRTTKSILGEHVPVECGSLRNNEKTATEIDKDTLSFTKNHHAPYLKSSFFFFGKYPEELTTGTRAATECNKPKRA